MSTLYITQAQPNPPGRDTVRRGHATPDQLNREWVEFEAREGARNLAGDIVSHLTFSNSCTVTGQDDLKKFGSVTLGQGQRARLHTGPGTDHWADGILHVYLNRDWFVWNNHCGDRATVRFQDSVLDSAAYRPDPPEGILVRVPGTDLLEPGPVGASAWR